MTTKTRAERYQTMVRELTDDELYVMLKAFDHAEFHRDGMLLPHVREDANLMHTAIRAEWTARKLHWSAFEGEYPWPE